MTHDELAAVEAQWGPPNPLVTGASEDCDAGACGGCVCCRGPSLCVVGEAMARRLAAALREAWAERDQMAETIALLRCR